MKLSMMSYTMARQPEHFSLESMLALTRDLKMDGIDFVTLHDTPAGELRKMAGDYGIPVVCHTFLAPFTDADPQVRAEALDDAKRGIAAAVELGAAVVMIPTCPVAGQDRDEARSVWIDGLRQLAPIAADAAVALTVENFPGESSSFVIADDFLQALAEVPSLKLTFDNGNAASGEDPAESFTRCGEHVVHAHFKDWTVRDDPADGYRRMLDGRYYRPALIGEGCVDHPACVAAMRQAGYDGCINIEYEGNEYLPADAVRKAVDYLRGLQA